MYRRKIETILQNWKDQAKRKPGYIPLRICTAIIPSLRNNAYCSCQLNPTRWTKREGITTRLSQKGIEFDPFELRVIQCLPHAKILNRIFKTHPVFDYIFRLKRILLPCDVRDTNIVPPVLRKRTDSRILDNYFFLLCHHLSTFYRFLRCR